MIKIAKQKWFYWHQVVESEYEKYKVGEILGLNTKKSSIYILDKNDPQNLIINLVKLSFIGKLPKTTDVKENFKQLIELCNEKKVPLTKCWIRSGIRDC